MARRIWAHFSQNRLFGSTMVLAATQFGASVMGLVRENVLARTFPGEHLWVVDSYISAFRPSDLLFQTCVVSALGTVLVPVLAQYRAHDKHRDVEKVLAGTIGMSALLFGCIALLLAIFFPYLVPLFNVRFEGEALQYYIQFGRLALLSNFLFVFGNAYGQYLVTIEKYWIYGLTPILYTLGTVLGTLFLTPIIGPYGPMIGTLGGAVMYVLLRMWAVHRSGCGIGMSLWHPELSNMAKLMLPRVLSLGAFQLQVMYLEGFATGLGEGAVTINAFTRNFQSVLVGVVGIAVAQSVYSRLSQASAKKDRAQFSRYLRLGVTMCLLLTIPGAIVLSFLAPVAAWLVHLSSVLPVFSICLMIYAVSIPFESLTHIQYRGFYALKETLTPAVIGVMGGIVAIVSGYLLLPRFGIYAVAAGFTIGEIIQVIGLSIMLPIREKKHFTSSSPA